MALIIVGAVVLAIALMFTLWFAGGIKAVACGVLTAIMVTAVGAYAFLPITGRGKLQLALGDLVSGLPGGSVIPVGVSAIPAAAWYVVSRVHARATRLGQGYAVLYCCLVGCCSIASGIVAAVACFPKQVRWVLLKLIERLPDES